MGEWIQSNGTTQARSRSEMTSGGCRRKVDLAHGALQRQRRFVDVIGTVQIGAVVAFARRRKAAFGKGKGYVEEEREVGTRQVVVAELEVENPSRQSPPGLPFGQFGALVGYVRIDIAVEDNGTPLGKPLPDLRSGFGPVAGEEQRHQIGVHLLHTAEFAAQKAGDEFAVYGGVEPREMHVFAPHAALLKHPAQHGHLGRFPGAVQSFEYYKHGLFCCIKPGRGSAPPRCGSLPAGVLSAAS